MTERQAVTAALYVLVIMMLVMAFIMPALWEIELFKVLLQAAAISGFINMVLAFHFAANKNDEVKSANTGKAFDALKAQAEATSGTQQVEIANEPVEVVNADVPDK